MGHLKADSEHKARLLLTEIINIPRYKPCMHPEPGETRKVLLQVDLVILSFKRLTLIRERFFRENSGAFDLIKLASEINAARIGKLLSVIVVFCGV